MLQLRSALAVIEAQPPRTRFACAADPQASSHSWAPWQPPWASTLISSSTPKNRPYRLPKPPASNTANTFRKKPQRTRQRTLGRSFVQP
jgi:hypothetical protein